MAKKQGLYKKPKIRIYTLKPSTLSYNTITKNTFAYKTIPQNTTG
jgi:hypothetical protein